MQYIGSKKTLATQIGNYIYSYISEYENNNINSLTFTDLFAGTGSMGLEMKKRGHLIIANDIQYYSYILNRYYIYLKSTKLISYRNLKIPKTESKGYLNVLDYLNKIEPVEGFIYNNYTPKGSIDNGDIRKYFSNENGMKIDAIRMQIEKWYINKEITKIEYETLIATLLTSADKVANVASVYGSFLKQLKSEAKNKLELKPLEQPINNNHKNKVYNENANKLIYRLKGDILYIDPPYNRRQYYTNYHMLETIAKYDNPELKGKTGLRANDGYKRSDYCLRKKVEDAFIELISNADYKYIIISYNNEGLLKPNEIKTLIKPFGQIKEYNIDHKRFKSNKKSTKEITNETLYCIKKTI